MRFICFLSTLFCFWTATLSAQPFAPSGQSAASQAAVATRDQVFNPDLKPFYHGVASGDPSVNGMVIWTRVTPEAAGPITVEWKVATDVQCQNIVASGTVTAEEARDYTVKVPVGGLSAGSTYYYYFRALGQNSLVGRAKTLPGGSVDHLRFGVVSCSNYEGGYFNAYGHLAERNDLDAIIHLGDYIYEYGTGVYGFNFPDRVNAPEYEILSLSDYRTRYSLYRLDPDLIRLHQQHTVISIWDDHESANDAYEAGAENHQSATEGSWEARKAISKRVYFEWMPIADNTDTTIYRQFTYGNLCNLIMLDTRLEGRSQPPANFDTPDVPARTMISPVQYNWFTQQLSNTQTRWKVVGNQVLFSTFNVGFAAGAFDGTPDPTNLDSIRQAENIFIDNWESYPTQRNQIIDYIKNNQIDNVVIVTGDSHSAWAFDVTKQAVQYPVAANLNLPAPNPYNAATGEGYNKTTGEGSWAVEFGTPSISSPNFDESIGADITALFESYMAGPIPPFNLEYNPHLKYVDLDRHGYILLDVKPDTTQANFYYVPSQLVDSVAANFDKGAFTVHTQNRVQVRTLPSSGKTVQDAATPLTPFGMVSAKQPANIALLGLAPNPAGEVCYLQMGLNSAQNIAVSILNEQGKVLRDMPSTAFPAGMMQYRLDLGGLPSGKYIVRIATEKEQISRWIVVAAR